METGVLEKPPLGKRWGAVATRRDMTKVCLLEALAHTQILWCQAGQSRQCSPTSETGRFGAAQASLPHF